MPPIFLPFEISLLVLEALVKDGSGLSNCAAVCRTWQRAVEEVTFRQLRVTPSRLFDLDRVVRSRKALVRHIKFCIMLPQYYCDVCGSLPLQTCHDIERHIVESSLRNLLHALSTWGSSDRGLMLEINIYSPSEVRHHLNDCILDDAPNLQQRVDHREVNIHGWGQIQSRRFPMEEAWFPGYRAYDYIFISEIYDRRLPRVTAVTGIQVRRQTRRKWVPTCLQDLMFCLPMVQTLYYEPWREANDTWQAIADKNHVRFLRRSRSSGLTRLVVFEIFHHTNPRTRLSGDYQGFGTIADPWESDTNISRALAWMSLKLEYLSASFMVDARHFFSACHSDWVWSELTSLALTSRILVPSDNHWEANQMLQTAAETAMNMPRLETMVLWYYRKEAVCAFIYQASKTDRWANVTWRGTWKVELEPVTIQSWQVVARVHASSDLSVFKDEMNASTALMSYGHAIEHLNLPCEVLHQDSIRRIQEEALELL